MTKDKVTVKPNTRLNLPLWGCLYAIQATALGAAVFSVLGSAWLFFEPSSIDFSPMVGLASLVGIWLGGFVVVSPLSAPMGVLVGRLIQTAWVGNRRTRALVLGFVAAEVLSGIVTIAMLGLVVCVLPAAACSMDGTLSTLKARMQQEFPLYLGLAVIMGVAGVWVSNAVFGRKQSMLGLSTSPTAG